MVPRPAKSILQPVVLADTTQQQMPMKSGEEMAFDDPREEAFFGEVEQERAAGLAVFKLGKKGALGGDLDGEVVVVFIAREQGGADAAHGFDEVVGDDGDLFAQMESGLGFGFCKHIACGKDVFVFGMLEGGGVDLDPTFEGLFGGGFGFGDVFGGCDLGHDVKQIVGKLDGAFFFAFFVQDLEVSELVGGIDLFEAVTMFDLDALALEDIADGSLEGGDLKDRTFGGAKEDLGFFAQAFFAQHLVEQKHHPMRVRPHRSRHLVCKNRCSSRKDIQFFLGDSQMFLSKDRCHTIPTKGLFCTLDPAKIKFGFGRKHDVLEVVLGFVFRLDHALQDIELFDLRTHPPNPFGQIVPQQTHGLFGLCISCSHQRPKIAVL